MNHGLDSPHDGLVVLAVAMLYGAALIGIEVGRMGFAFACFFAGSYLFFDWRQQKRED